MWRPQHFALDDRADCLEVMRAHPFAILVSQGGEGLIATHVPVVVHECGDELFLRCHFARPNPHWKALTGAEQALVIFTGPHGYVSPNWYPSKAEAGKVVPTWNYVSVHAYGRARVVQDSAWLKDNVAELSDIAESQSPTPWSLEDAPDTYIAAMLRGIVGIEIQVDRLEGKAKLSQNKDHADFEGVIRGLDERRQAGDLQLRDGMRAVRTGKI